MTKITHNEITHHKKQTKGLFYSTRVKKIKKLKSPCHNNTIMLINLTDFNELINKMLHLMYLQQNASRKTELDFSHYLSDICIDGCKLIGKVCDILPISIRRKHDAPHYRF